MSTQRIKEALEPKLPDWDESAVDRVAAMIGRAVDAVGQMTSKTREHLLEVVSSHGVSPLMSNWSKNAEENLVSALTTRIRQTASAVQGSVKNQKESAEQSGSHGGGKRTRRMKGARSKGRGADFRAEIPDENE